MQTSNTQLGLITGLAIGLGYTLSSTQAVGYPGSASISVGSNPVVAVGGTISDATAELFTAPSDQDVVVTDIWLTMANRSCSSSIALDTSAGETLSVAKLYSYFWESTSEATNSHPDGVQHAFGSGLPLPAGQTLSIQESGGCSVAYTISGHYAQP